ncbi:hypothetical protein PG988_004127 [Apiospora saccharicola]
MAFQCFPRLPCELRIMIFKEALRNETQHRLIVLSEANRPRGLTWNTRVHPFTDLVSPFLSVNRVSRDVAQRFFTCKLAVYEVPQKATELSSPDDDVYWTRKASTWFQEMASLKVTREEYPEYRGMLYPNLERDIVTTAKKVIKWRIAYWRATAIWNRLSALGPRHYITEALGETDRFMVRRHLVVAPKPGGTRTMRFSCLCTNDISLRKVVPGHWADFYWQVHRFLGLTERLELDCRSDTVEDEFLRDRAANRDRLLSWPAYEIRRWSSGMYDASPFYGARTACREVYVQDGKLVQPGFWPGLGDRLRYWVYVARGCMWFAAVQSWYRTYLDMFARLGMHQL